MAKSDSEAPLVVLTVGHSTRPLEDFIHLLQAHEVKKVVDVRTVPRSRHNPQFNRDTLPQDLKTCHIGYIQVSGLGGLRHARTDSLNMGWRNASFRGYADYMQTEEFEKNLAKVTEFARRERIALMCAEALPLRCHRSLIANALLIRDIRVEHIMTPPHCQRHSLTPFARVRGTRITYPPVTEEESEDADRSKSHR